MAKFVETNDPQLEVIQLSRTEAVQIIERLAGQLGKVGAMAAPNIDINEHGQRRYRIALVVED